MVQSMVPEVSLFFGDDDSTFGPSVQHPSNRLSGMVRPSSQHQPMASFTPSHTSRDKQSPNSESNVPSQSAQNRSVPVSASSYLSNAGPKPPVQNNPANSAQQQFVRSPNSQVDNVVQSQGQPAHHHPHMSTAVGSHPTGVVSTSQPGYYGAHPPTSNMVRPPYCNCPSCPKPFPPQYYRSQSYEPVRSQGPTYPRHSHPHYGHPPPRLNGPQFSGNPYPHHQGLYPQTAGIVSHSFPPPSNSDYQQPPGTSYPVVQSGPANGIQGGNIPVQNGHGPPAARTLPPIPASSVPSSYPNMVHPVTAQQEMPQSNPRLTVPVPQASGGLPVRADNRGAAVNNQMQSGEGVNVNASGEVRRSNPSSDNSGRSSDDSGLSFTPEKHHSPSNPSLKVQPKPEPESAGDLKSVVPTVNWENIPPEIYQLLMKQNEQLRQLQAQIEVLTAQSLNTTAESAVTMKSHPSHEIQKCSTATNTSAGLGGKEQVSACMQTSQEVQAFENPRQTYPNDTDNRNMSNSSSSGCETRTPLEIRHRGRLPMNSTQRDDGELDISQGELVALMNNMHDKTIDSVQSEMIVDLPSFQSSPSRSVYSYICLVI